MSFGQENMINLDLELYNLKINCEIKTFQKTKFVRKQFFASRYSKTYHSFLTGSGSFRLLLLVDSHTLFSQGLSTPTGPLYTHRFINGYQ